jgi:hypothetical protein
MDIIPTAREGSIVGGASAGAPAIIIQLAHQIFLWRTGDPPKLLSVSPTPAIDVGPLVESRAFRFGNSDLRMDGRSVLLPAVARLV